MRSPPSGEITRLLDAFSAGDHAAAERLMPLVYDELRRIAACSMRLERPGHTLQPTALVHEAYFRLIGQQRVDWQGRTHFFSLAAHLMRRILIDYARSRRARKRNGPRTGLSFKDGPDFKVMDYVQGQPIDEYCETNGLTVRQRLELFRVVCAAVHYAHQNLVIHRDLKPANIWVTPEGLPKLLDFGIAKLLKPEFLPLSAGLTRTDVQPMTPEFASPEQMAGWPITTASDIYSLGVLLYELLTGAHPYWFSTITQLELERVICEDDPERPSLVAQRAVPARRLDADLDMIVLMAMRKEPQRRYASADQFAEDIRRYLEGRPVIARRDTLGYRLTKFAGRHKAGLAAAVIASAALLGGAGVSAGLSRNRKLRRTITAITPGSC